MWKWVVRDYFTAFRGEQCKTWLKNSWWTVLYFGIFLPLISHLFDEPKHVFVYACIMLPLLFSIFTEGWHTLALPKVMYLCPLSQEERKEYIEKSCVFRIVFHSMIGITGVLLLLVTGHCGYVEAGVAVFHSVSWTIVLCGFDRNRVLDEKYRERMRSNGATQFMMSGMLETFSMLINACATFGFVGCLCWNTQVYWWVKWIFVGVAVLIQLPLTIRLLKNWDLAIEHAASYEESFL